MSAKKPKRDESKQPAQNVSSVTKPVSPSGFSDGDAPVYRKIFFIAFAVMAVMLAVMSQSTGINGDEKYHTYIANHILEFYSSFGKDTSLFISKKEALALIKERGEEGAEEMGVDVDDIPMSNDLMYYGGFFEVISAVCARIFGYEDDTQLGFHNLRHFLISIFGALIILFTGLTAKEIFNWRAALIAALLLFITPRFFGHALMNPKDIPFAFGYMMSLFFMVRFLKEFPAPEWKTTLWLLAGIAISINIRIGGILLMLYLLLFVALFAVYHGAVKKDMRFNSKHGIGNIAVKIACILVLGYFLGLLFWPFGLIDPIENPLAALSRFSKYPAKINQLFEGEQIRSHKLPWHYLPKYLLISNPLIVISGVGLFALLLFWMKNYFRRDLALIVLFLFAFPVLYIIYKKSTVYSGARHVLFINPPMVVLAALGWEGMLKIVKPLAAKSILAALMALMCVYPAQWVFAEHPLQYVYFNQLVGGTKKAYTDYVTDYWQLSVKEASEWLVKNVPQDKKIVVATNCPYPVGIYLSNWADSFEVKYTRYYLRSDADWDYGIFYVDYVEPYQLRNGFYPPDHTIYTVKADDAPMCVVIKRVDKSDYLGFQAVDAKDYDKALLYFQQATKVYPHSEAVFMGLGATYLFRKEPEMAMEPLKRSLQLHPDQGLVNYYLGLAHAQLNMEDRAILYLQRAIELNRKIKPAYTLLAAIYEQKGEMKAAEFYRNLGKKIQMPAKK